MGRVPRSAAPVQVREGLGLSVFVNAGDLLDRLVRRAHLAVEVLGHADAGFEMVVDAVCSIGDTGQVPPEFTVFAEHVRTLPGDRDGLLESRLHLLGAAEPLLDDVVHLAQPVVNALRDPAALAHQVPPSRDRLLQRRPLGPRMPAPARGLGEVQLGMLAPMVFQLEPREVLERALLSRAQIRARHHLLVRLAGILHAGVGEALVEIAVVLRERVGRRVAVSERPVQPVVALARPIAEPADEMACGVVADNVGEARRQGMHLREDAVDLVAGANHLVERMLGPRRLPAHPDATLDALAAQFFQRGERLARAGIRHRFALEQLLGCGEALQFLQRVECAGIERVQRAAGGPFERVLERAAGRDGGDATLERADADLRQRSDLQEGDSAGERAARRRGQHRLPVLAFADGLHRADAGADDGLHHDPAGNEAGGER